MRMVHKIIRSASRLAQTLSDHSSVAGPESLVEIGSLIVNMEPNKKSDENNENKHENIVETRILLLGCVRQ